MSSLDGKSTCDEFGDGGDKGLSVSISNKKERTSCEQKVEHCKNDGADNNTSGSCNSDIDTVAESISKVDISNNDNNSDKSSTDDNGIVKGVESLAISDEDEKLFADPPPKEDCPICMLPMPFASGVCGVKTTYMSCCGKTLCEGCVLASAEEVVKGKLKKWCALCRVPCHHSNKELMNRFDKRMKLNDANAFCRLGYSHFLGERGLPKNSKKAFELWSKAAELGSIDGHSCVARAYLAGDEVEQHVGKGIYHGSLQQLEDMKLQGTIWVLLKCIIIETWIEH